MKTGVFQWLRLETILATMFFVGIGLTHFTTIPWMMDGTFLVGILSIYFIARSKKEVVVYLEKKNEVVEEEIKKDEHQSQFNDATIKEIIKNNHNKKEVPQLVLNSICDQLKAGQGAIYIQKNNELKLEYGYAISSNTQLVYASKEGLVGRVAAEAKTLYLDEIPNGYITVFSGLGNISPRRLALIPIQSGVIEIATFADINSSTLKHIEEACSGILK